MIFLKNKKCFIAIFILISSAISSCDRYSDSILIRITDSSKCDLLRYSFVMPEMTVSFSPEQLAVIEVKRPGELFLEIPIADQASDTFKYKVRAEYGNCSEILSSERTVKRGYIIYESIYGNKIDYTIRAR